MLYNRCTGIYKFGNNTYPRPIRGRSNVGHIFRKKKVRLIGGKVGTFGMSVQSQTHVAVSWTCHQVAGDTSTQNCEKVGSIHRHYMAGDANTQL